MILLKAKTTFLIGSLSQYYHNSGVGGWVEGGGLRVCIVQGRGVATQALCVPPRDVVVLVAFVFVVVEGRRLIVPTPRIFSSNPTERQVAKYAKRRDSGLRSPSKTENPQINSDRISQSLTPLYPMDSEFSDKRVENRGVNSKKVLFRQDRDAKNRSFLLQGQVLRRLVF